MRYTTNLDKVEDFMRSFGQEVAEDSYYVR